MPNLFIGILPHL